MGGFSDQPDPESFRCGLGEPFSIDQAPLRIPSKIVEGIDLCNPFLPDQFHAALCSGADFLPGLKNQIDIPVQIPAGEFKRQPTEGGTVAVMAAFMRDAAVF